MCEKGKLLAQHVLFLITVHLAREHLQNKQLECDDAEPSATCMSSSEPVLQAECVKVPVHGTVGAYSIAVQWLDVGPGGCFVQAETWLDSSLAVLQARSYTHTHTPECSPRSLTHLNILSAHSASDV